MPRWRWGCAAILAAVIAGALLWWSRTADVRALRSLPDEQRLAIYSRALANLKNTCDPAAPRSLRDFCRTQAALAIKFRECEAYPHCLDVTNRHLFPTRH